MCWKIVVRPVLLRPIKLISHFWLDTIQTALHNASILVRSLLNLGKPGASPVLSTVASSSSLTASNHDPSQLRTRTEYMNSLSNAMKKNIRIRYELNGSEIIQA
jgi:rapamycin-insensitive companion of mTOR